jgi:ketosteroid isomerase-like protein
LRSRGAILLALSLALLALVGCSTNPTKAAPTSLRDEIVAKERQGLDALKIGDLSAFAKLTADDAVFIDAHGIASKADVMTNVAGFKLRDYAIEDVKLVPLSDTSGLISYRITEEGTSHGRDFSAKAYVSSLWAQRNGEWVCVFSQETAAK